MNCFVNHGVRLISFLALVMCWMTPVQADVSDPLSESSAYLSSEALQVPVITSRIPFPVTSENLASVLETVMRDRGVHIPQATSAIPVEDRLRSLLATRERMNRQVARRGGPLEMVSPPEFASIFVLALDASMQQSYVQSNPSRIWRSLQKKLIDLLREVKKDHEYSLIPLDAVGHQAHESHPGLDVAYGISSIDLRRMVRGLDADTRRRLNLRLGLVFEPPHSFDEMGNLYDLTGNTMRVAQDLLYPKLRRRLNPPFPTWVTFPQPIVEAWDADLLHFLKTANALDLLRVLTPAQAWAVLLYRQDAMDAETIHHREYPGYRFTADHYLKVARMDHPTRRLILSHANSLPAVRTSPQWVAEALRYFLRPTTPVKTLLSFLQLTEMDSSPLIVDHVLMRRPRVWNHLYNSALKAVPEQKKPVHDSDDSFVIDLAHEYDGAGILPAFIKLFDEFIRISQLPPTRLSRRAA